MNEKDSGIWLNNLDDLTFGLGLVVFTCMIGHLLKKFIHQPNMRIQLRYKRVLYELIGTAEMSVVVFELCFIVYDNYPFYIFLLGIFCYGIWASSGDVTFQTVSNPVEIVAMYLAQEIRFEMAVIIVLAQVVGASLPYLLIVKPAWYHASWWCVWKVENVHTHKIMEKTWQTAVNTTTPVISAISESSITCLMYLTTKFMSTVTTLPAGTERFVTIFLNTILAGIGTPFSGGFYNPAIASAVELILRTTGVNFATKFWVYWIAPIFGMILALFLESYLIPPRPRPRE